MKKKGLPPGPKPKHGGYSIARRDDLLARRPEVLRYLEELRRDIVADISPEGEEHLTAARRLLLDRLLQKVATSRLVECYVAEEGILRKDRENTLEAEPILTLWLSLNNQIREDLKLLGLERRPLGVKPLSPGDLLRLAEEDEKAREKAGNGPGSAQEGQTARGEGRGKGARGVAKNE